MISFEFDSDMLFWQCVGRESVMISADTDLTQTGENRNGKKTRKRHIPEREFEEERALGEECCGGAGEGGVEAAFSSDVAGRPAYEGKADSGCGAGGSEGVHADRRKVFCEGGEHENHQVKDHSGPEGDGCGPSGEVLRGGRGERLAEVGRKLRYVRCEHERGEFQKNFVGPEADRREWRHVRAGLPSIKSWTEAEREEPLHNCVWSGWAHEVIPFFARSGVRSAGRSVPSDGRSAFRRVA